MRQSRGITQEVLADAVGLAPTYVGQLERGQRNPTLSVVERFAAYFDVDPMELLKPLPL
ncbi:helix-turn-helix domain-containing protein [Phenylobacterium sp. J426]|nr:helix-turn-helix domain-containing protein [Phenylobacterium sp. J426]